MTAKQTHEAGGERANRRRPTGVVEASSAHFGDGYAADERALPRSLSNQAVQRQIVSGTLTPNVLARFAGLSPGILGNQAMQRVLKTPATRPAIVQRYTEEDVGGDPTRISDDHTAAVTQESAVGGKELFAEASLITDANQKLKSVHSGIELDVSSGTMTLPDDKGGSLALQQVWPKNLQNKTGGVKKTTGSAGPKETLNPMQLWADCGKSNGVVIGGTNRRAVFESQSDSTEFATATGGPSKMKIQVLLKILKEVAAQFADQLKLLSEDDPTRPVIESFIKDVRDTALAVDKRWAEIKSMEAKAKSKEEWATINRAYTALSNVVLNLYNSQGDEWQEAANKNAKINEFAQPEIGQGFTISSGGERFEGVMTWNFHWAGVILKSEDQADSVTLENYAVGDASVQNTEWVFQMYGHRKRDQTFHQQHRGFQQHGKTPTTMVVENVPKTGSTD